MSNTIQSLWQHQEPRLNQMELSDFRRKAGEALSQDRRHKAVVPITTGILVACFGLLFLASEEVVGRIGSGVGIAAGLSMAYRAYRMMKTHPLLPGALGIDAYRRILQREQKALTICWQTMLLVQAGVALQMVGGPGRGARHVIAALAMVAPVVVVALLTRAKARAYWRRAQELDRL